MSKYRFAAKVDANQPNIVKELRMLGYSVEVGHDDILVGHAGKTYWFELKEPGSVSKKTGEVLESEKKESQKRLEKEWKGHYKIVWNIDQILNEIK
jgi:ribonucleotide reductase alpha subunit